MDGNGAGKGRGPLIAVGVVAAVAALVIATLTLCGGAAFLWRRVAVPPPAPVAPADPGEPAAP